MADIAQVAAAVDEVVARMDHLEPETRRKIPDRTISAWIRDLDVAYSGRFVGGHLIDVAEIDPADAKVAAFRLTLDSDDFIDLVEDRLSFGSGWAHGRIKVDAKFRDVLELRRFL